MMYLDIEDYQFLEHPLLSQTFGPRNYKSIKFTFWENLIKLQSKNFEQVIDLTIEWLEHLIEKQKKLN